MKEILTPITNQETSKKSFINTDSKPISSVFPNGKFSDSISNPFRDTSEMINKSNLDKFSNVRQTIQKQSIKVRLKII